MIVLIDFQIRYVNLECLDDAFLLTLLYKS